MQILVCLKVDPLPLPYHYYSFVSLFPGGIGTEIFARKRFIRLTGQDIKSEIREFELEA